MRIAIPDLSRRLHDAARAHGVAPDDSNVIVDHFLDSELRGKTNHGVRRFCVECPSYAAARGRPSVSSERGALATVDGSGSPGPIGAALCVDVVTRLAASSGIAAVGMTNSRRLGALSYWSERIAEQGQFGLVMNSGPVECTLPGNSVPLSGVNPMSFAVPTSGEPIVGDFAMSLGTMGALWTTRNEGAPMPLHTYLDEAGDWATDGESAMWAAIFGGHRGLALATMVQVMTGSLLGSPMAGAVLGPSDVGFLFLAVDNSRIVEPVEYRERNSRYAGWFEGRSSSGTNRSEARLCGTASARRRREALDAGYLDVDQVALDQLEELVHAPRLGQ